MNLGRAIGGFGAAAAALSSKYIDEELLQERQRRLQELQFEGRQKTEAWEQSPEVQGPRLSNQRKARQAQHDDELTAKVNEQSDPSLRQARIDNESAYLRGVAPARVEAENTVVEGTAGARLDAERMRRLVLDPLDVSKDGAIHEQREAARLKREDALKSDFDKLPDRLKAEIKSVADDLKEIGKAITKARADGMWQPAQNPGQTELVDEQKALRRRLQTLLRGAGGEGDALGLFGESAGTAAQVEPAAKPAKKMREARAAPARQIQTATTPTGETVYRYEGQDRWHPSKVAALAALGALGARDRDIPQSADGFFQD